MQRRTKFAFCVICILRCGLVEAQQQPQNSRTQIPVRRAEPVVAFQPVFVYGGHGLPHSHRPGGLVVYQPFLFQPIQVVPYTYPVSTVPVPNLYPFEAQKPITMPSSAAARLKSLDLQARGDQKMRDQKWPEAKLAYTNSMNAAPERSAAHMRLALSYIVTQRYDSAIREVKRALAIDHNLAVNGDRLEIIFGPDSKTIRTSIVSKLSTWVRDDHTNPDRLFLYGVILHFNSDPRSKETLEAALHTKPGSDVSHISMFLERSQNDVEHKGFPKLNNRPDPVMIAQPHFDLRFPKSPVPAPDGPVPMPDAPVPMP